LAFNAKLREVAMQSVAARPRFVACTELSFLAQALHELLDLDSIVANGDYWSTALLVAAERRDCDRVLVHVHSDEECFHEDLRSLLHWATP
jgi:hypothetical protein